MIKINLETELLKQNKVIHLHEVPETLAVKEYKKNKELADNEVIERIGLNDNFLKAKKLIAVTESHNAEKAKNKRETERFDQSRVFHISQIKSLCMKYYLRFLPIEYYKGTIDKELPTKIMNFELASSITCREDNLRICAPPESFELQEKPKDPLLFYHINDEYFYLIHKWGNDLNITRRLLSIFSGRWTIFAGLGVLSFIFMHLIGLFNTDNLTIGNYIGVAIGSYLLCGLVITVIAMAINDHKLYSGMYIPKNKWNSKYL